jgi:hypothetical protein
MSLGYPQGWATPATNVDHSGMVRTMAEKRCCRQRKADQKGPGALQGRLKPAQREPWPDGEVIITATAFGPLPHRVAAVQWSKTVSQRARPSVPSKAHEPKWPACAGLSLSLQIDWEGSGRLLRSGLPHYAPLLLGEG